MKILIITHSFAPALSPRSIRWQRVIDWLVAGGHTIDVVCGRAAGSAAFERSGHLSIYRCGGGLLERVRVRLKGTGTRQAAATPGATRSPGAAGRTAMKWLHDNVWKRLYWPDYACLWIPAAAWRATRLMRARRYDAMVSVSPPYSGHLVALVVRRRYPRVPWLVDIGDPFALLDGAQINNASLYRRANFRLERRVLRRCDGLSVTTGRTARMYAERFGVDTGRITVVPPIVRPPAGGSLAERRVNADGPIRGLYAGTFYERIREPDAMIALLEGALRLDARLAERFELDVFGDIGPFRARFERAPLLRARTRLHAAVTPEALASHLRGADVLINVGNVTSYQLPSKIVEYMAQCKPILNVCHIEDDSSAELLQTYPAALSATAPVGAAELARVVSFLLDAPAAKVDPALVEGITRQFRPEQVGGQYESILGFLSQRPAQGPAKDVP